MIYNISMKLRHLLENEQAVQVMQNTMPGLLKMVQANPQALGLSVEQLVRYSRVPQAEALLGKLDATLQQLNTPENAISPSETKQIAFFRELWQQEQQAPKKEKTHRQNAIYPGQPWLDTKGERIQAHGGAVYYENGTYYWYGENKSYTDGKNGIWTWGLKVYASRDLYNWDDLGYLIPPGAERSQFRPVSHQAGGSAPCSEMPQNREICVLGQALRPGGRLYHLAGRRLAWPI